MGLELLRRPLAMWLTSRSDSSEQKDTWTSSFSVQTHWLLASYSRFFVSSIVCFESRRMHFEPLFQNTCLRKHPDVPLSLFTTTLDLRPFYHVKSIFRAEQNQEGWNLFFVPCRPPCSHLQQKVIGHLYCYLLVDRTDVADGNCRVRKKARAGKTGGAKGLSKRVVGRMGFFGLFASLFCGVTLSFEAGFRGCWRVRLWQSDEIRWSIGRWGQSKTGRWWFSSQKSHAPRPCYQLQRLRQWIVQLVYNEC